MTKTKIEQEFERECWWLKYKGSSISCNSRKMILQANDAIQQIKEFSR